MFNSDRSHSLTESGFIQQIKLTVDSSISKLYSDPLLSCFKQSKESQEYMFDRINEIISSSIAKLAGKKMTELLQRASFLEQRNNELSESIQTLLSENSRLGVISESNSVKDELCRIKNSHTNLIEKNQQLQESLDLVNEKLFVKDQYVEDLKKKLTDLETEHRKSLHSAPQQGIQPQTSQIVNELKARNIDLEEKCNHLLQLLESHQSQQTVNKNVDEFNQGVSFEKQLLENEREKSEELTFKNEQLKQTVDELKREILSINSRLSEEKSKRHQSDLSGSKFKEEKNQLQISNACLSDEIRKLSLEV